MTLIGKKKIEEKTPLIRYSRLERIASITLTSVNLEQIETKLSYQSSFVVIIPNIFCSIQITIYDSFNKK